MLIFNYKLLIIIVVIINTLVVAHAEERYLFKNFGTINIWNLFITF